MLKGFNVAKMLLNWDDIIVYLQTQFTKIFLLKAVYYRLLLYTVIVHNLICKKKLLQQLTKITNQYNRKMSQAQNVIELTHHKHSCYKAIYIHKSLAFP